MLLVFYGQNLGSESNKKSTFSLKKLKIKILVTFRDNHTGLEIGSNK